MNKKILSFMLIAMLLVSNFILPTIASADTITEPKVVFSLSEEKDFSDKAGGGTQVELTLTAYNLEFNLMQFTLGYDVDKVVYANRNSNVDAANFNIGHTLIADKFGEDEDTGEVEGWYTVVGTPDFDSTNGSLKFTFSADPASRGIDKGSNAKGFVEAGSDGLDILKFHFRKVGEIDKNTFKILGKDDSGGNPANLTGLVLGVDADAAIRDTSYVVFDLGLPDDPDPDTEAPVITLNGDATITLEKGDTFTDPGVTVTDNVDEGLTAVVTYTKDGNPATGIDTNVPGTYVIYYNATDAAGNEAVEKTRTVIVKEEPVQPGDSDAKFTVESASVVEGEEVTVSVTGADFDDVYGYQMDISYDEDRFDEVALINIPSSNFEYNIENGLISVALASRSPIAGGNLFDIKLKAKAEGAVGATDLKVELVKVSIEAGVSTAIDVTNKATKGTITIETSEPEIGDVDGNGQIDGNDVLAILKHLVRLDGYVLDAEQLLRADFNGDGEVDIADAVAILKTVNGE